MGFENKVIDILEFLSRFPELFGESFLAEDQDTVLYDAPCHLMHAQKVDENPRQLLNIFAGVKLVPLKESNWCWGFLQESTILFNLTSHETSEAKTESVRQTLRKTQKRKPFHR
ncbi:MAG: hypothetical protein Ct9H300mP21_01920 [Pseudomonadota bacterium]|nr:MAG: hypothetical protein Ct9H300mP21_01920 [Pseudomonadota bacterium]